MLEELLNLRKEFVKKRERFRILNHHYNELLIKKHTLNEQNNSFPAIEKSKAYKIMRIVHNVICLFVGTMFVFETIGLGKYILSYRQDENADDGEGTVSKVDDNTHSSLDESDRNIYIIGLSFILLLLITILVIQVRKKRNNF